MPVKKRRPKSRHTPAAEMAAWRMFFRTGHDYLNDLARVGLDDGRGFTNEATAAAAAPDAWRRLGADFLDAYGRDEARWALAHLGEPR